MLGTCRRWLVHSSVWPPSSISRSAPSLLPPCPALAGPAAGGARRQGRGISSGLCYVTRLCLLAPGAAARRGGRLCAHEFPEHPEVPRVRRIPNPRCGDGTCGCCPCRGTRSQALRCRGPFILSCREGVGKALISSAPSLTHPGSSAQAVPLSGAHILFQLNHCKQASST